MNKLPLTKVVTRLLPIVAQGGNGEVLIKVIFTGFVTRKT